MSSDAVTASHPLMPTLDGCRAALQDVLPATVVLVKRLAHPDRPSTPGWTAADTATHLSHVLSADLAAARHEPMPVDFQGDVAAMNAAALAADTEREPGALAQRIAGRGEELIEVLEGLDGSEERTWLGGLPVTATTVASHVVYEALLHGRDIARSQGRRWPIAAEHAIVASMGFSLALIRTLPPTFFVDQEAAKGVEGTVEVRLRRGPSFGMRLAGGELTIAEQVDEPVDCHLSATPTAWLLSTSGRGRLLPALARGEMLAWGRRPTFARVLARVLRSP